MSYNYKNPIYEFSIDSRECAIELCVNDLPCFSNYEHGGIALDWPVNANLLSSGKQFYSLSVFPFEEENYINKKAAVKVKIFVRDVFDSSKPKRLISEVSIPEFSKEEEQRKEFHVKGEFDADIPYNHEGWRNSVNLMNENKKLLFEEIENFYIKLYEIFKSYNIEEYKKLTHIRFYELCKSFYLTENEMKKREISFIPQFKGEIQKEEIQNYQMSMYGNGKLIALRIDKEPIGLKFFSNNETDNIIYEQAFFHRKHTGAPLSLVR